MNPSEHAESVAMPLLQQYTAVSATMCWSSLLNTVPILSLAVVLCRSTQHHTLASHIAVYLCTFYKQTPRKHLLVILPSFVIT